MISPNPKPAAISVLASDLQIDGDIRCTGLVELHAKITGNVVADELSIEGEAEVRGDVAARRLKVDGAVFGTVVATDVTITSIGRVSGGISYETLTVHAGATLNGELKRVRPTNGVSQASGPVVA